jgi:hypothetical protein
VPIELLPQEERAAHARSSRITGATATSLSVLHLVQLSSLGVDDRSPRCCGNVSSPTQASALSAREAACVAYHARHEASPRKSALWVWAVPSDEVTGDSVA